MHLLSLTLWHKPVNYAIQLASNTTTENNDSLDETQACTDFLGYVQSAYMTAYLCNKDVLWRSLFQRTYHLRSQYLMFPISTVLEWISKPEPQHTQGLPETFQLPLGVIKRREPHSTITEELANCYLAFLCIHEQRSGKILFADYLAFLGRRVISHLSYYQVLRISIKA